ncbi:MAG: Gfo/Idh/MocA family oxidoreductase [Candidatus Omnitrophica bacterium]|nr:Gfo/Idh/MocA family oxidoreductase [Candidatus Omnitrophota bacterium]
MGFKILLVGCGQLGSRHLQAIASLKNVTEICVVDSSQESLDRSKARLGQIDDLNPEIDFQWFKEIDYSWTAGDLCIIATQAKGRCQLLKQVVQGLGYERFLIEKIVSQSVEEYEDLLSFCKEKNVSVWVNCKTRTYEIHKYIKSKLKSSEPIIFSAIGGNYGLANNGVHVVDLFVFYDQATKLYSCGSKVDEVLHPSKRGQDILDLSGSLFGYSDKASKFMLTFAADHMSPDHITINTPRCRFIVDHFQKFAYESYSDQDWTWNKIPIEEEWRVSHMSKKFVSDILTKDTCQLPTIFECFLAHEFILRGLLLHFNRLLKEENWSCPVT